MEMRTLATTLCAVALLAGCASTEAAQSHSSTTFLRSASHSAPSAGRSSASGGALACPLWTTPTPSRGDRLATDPISAIACFVNQMPQKRRPGVPIRTDLARSIVRFLNAAPLAPAAQSARCAPTRKYVAVVIRFGYPDGTTADVSEVAPTCAGIVFVDGRGYAAGSVLSSFVFDLTGQSAQPPDVLGDSLPVVATVARRARLTLEPPDELRTTASAPGTVLLESLLDGQLSLVIAVAPTAPPCTAPQLALQYLPGGAGTGNDFGQLVLRNTSGGWCALGALRVTGRDARGQDVTPTVAVPAGPLTDLSPHAAAERPGSAPVAGQSVAIVQLIAGYRDDPTAPNGMCTPHWVIPATWRVTVGGGTLTVRNAQAKDGRPPGAAGLITCRGAFRAILATTP